MYTITLIVPAGTIAFNTVIKDTIPVGQTYIGLAYRNGVLIAPAYASNAVTFSAESTIDASIAAVTITYTIFCKQIWMQ